MYNDEGLHANPDLVCNSRTSKHGTISDIQPRDAMEQDLVREGKESAQYKIYKGTVLPSFQEVSHSLKAQTVDATKNYLKGP